MNAEFDRFAAEYKELVRHPIRDWFSPDARYYVVRKLEVLLGLAEALGRDTRLMTWLDVGCGDGELLRTGRSHFTRAIGCDVSAAMIESCADLEVVSQQTPVAIPLPDESVDWVTAVCVYHHIDPADRLRLTADIHRVLRPGGVFVIVEHNPLNPAVQIIVRRTAMDEHAVLLRAATAKRMMHDAGFTVAATHYFLYLPQRIYRRGRAIERALAHVPLGGQYCVAGVKAGG